MGDSVPGPSLFYVDAPTTDQHNHDSQSDLQLTHGTTQTEDFIKAIGQDGQEKFHISKEGDMTCRDVYSTGVNAINIS